MPNLIFDLRDIKLDVKNHFVFYSSNEMIIYKNSNLITIATCDGTIIKETKCPPDWKHFHCIEDNNQIILLFSGKYFLVIDKDGFRIHEQLLDIEKTGRISCKPVLFNKHVIFGTSIKGKSQFIKFDIVNNKRIFQTMSLALEPVSNLEIHENICYGVVGQSVITQFSANSGEILSSRFETDIIGDSIAVNGKQILVAYQGNIKQIEGAKSKIIKVPFVKVNNILSISDNLIYVSCNEGKNLLCFDLETQKVKWELKGSRTINCVAPSRGCYGKQKHDIMFVAAENYFTVIDLTSGQSVYQTAADGLFDLKLSNNALLLQKYTGRSTLLIGDV